MPSGRIAIIGAMLAGVLSPAEAETLVSRRIVCAAVRLPGGTLLVGPRHYDAVMRRQMISMGIQEGLHHGEQGFVNTHGEFLTREEAWKVAQANNQIVRRVGGDEGRLYSENLY